MNVKQKANIVVPELALFLLILLILFLVVPLVDIQQKNFFVIITFLINGTLWTLLLTLELKKHPFSFAMIIWCFSLFFYFFAALVQYIYGTFPWIEYRSDEALINANMLLLLWTIGIWGGQHIKIRKRERVVLKKIEIFKNENIVESKWGYRLLLFMAVGITMWRVATIGIVNLLARSTSGYQMSDNNALALLLEHSMQAIEYFSVVLLFKISPKNWRGRAAEVIGIISLAVAYPPTGLSRYAAAVIYLGMLLTLCTRLRNSRCFIFVFIGAFMFFLPALNAFRNVGFEDVNLSSIILDVIKSFKTTWLAGDYDAYTMFTLSIDYVDQNGITWLTQFLGAMLFWVPRTIWPSKPIGSGAYMAQKLNWSFTNLSCPLPGEAMINIGVFGIVIFSVLIGRIIKKLDDEYWNWGEKNNRSIDVLYPPLVIFFFFMNRGDLMSSMAFMSAYVVIGTILTHIFYKYNRFPT